MVAGQVLGLGAKGAETAHWAYVQPTRPSRPVVQDASWPRNEIDYFVLDKLEQNGFAASPPADKVTLVRRVSLDLTGLPPTPEAVNAFLSDESSAAYERLVDRLLASPQYGERMTAWWLDMARYADTNGYEGDGSREIWLYRDWAISAFQQGMPFDQFTIEQLAGDLLPEPTDDQRIATGFHRNTPFCYEAGTDLEQFRVESVVDRVNTTMTVWMGTTMACSQCHDHKYDPFSQREYFQLYSFFNNADEDNGRGATLSARSPLNRESTEAMEAEIAQLRETLTVETPELATAQAAWEKSLTENRQWHMLVAEQYVSLDGATLQRLDDHSILVSGENPQHDTYELLVPWDGSSITAIGLEVLNHESLPHNGPGRYEENGNFRLARVQAAFASPDSPDQWQSILFVKAFASYEEDGGPGGVIDDDDATDWCTNKEAAHAVFIADRDYHVPAGSLIRIRLRHHSENGQHGVGRFRLWASTGSTDAMDQEGLAPLPTLAILENPVGQRTDELNEKLRDQIVEIAPHLAPIRRRIAELESAASPASTMVMIEREEPRETRLLIRGSYLDPGDVVQPAIPSAWHDWPDGAPLNRLGLAKWLVRPDNPLVGRVTMNRIWAIFFGKGIVETSEDFGTQGSRPKHPELLDYLATQFVEGGWDLQAMQKQIVMSATYRQSSRLPAELNERDPNNDFFARGPAFRLDAEMIRDLALVASGLFTERIGGPGVYPYQPPGIFEQIHSFTTGWETSTDGDQFRRALYIWWKRTAPYPSMLTFDAARRSVCAERRPRTNTPLQALVTLNDPVFVQCAAALGRRMAREVDGDERKRVAHGFQLCVARLPTEQETDQLVELYRENLAIYQNDGAGAHAIASSNLPNPLPKDVPVSELAAWSVVGNVLLNLDETMTKY
jgi:hypothetical protein